MPEDYQAIFDSLGVDTSAQTQESTTGANQNSQPAATESTGATIDTNPKAPESNTTSSEQDPASNTATSEDNDAANQHRNNEAFAAMRSEISKYKKFMQHIMKGANYSGDESSFMEALTDASYKRQAQTQGSQVSPEVLKRMDSLEAQNQSLIDAQNRQAFTANLKSMQETLNLDEKDIKEFVNLAIQEHIDLTVPGTNFVTLYQGLFYNKLRDRDIELERQKWIEQNNKAGNATNPDGKSGKKDPNPTNVNTMAEFNSLLQSIPSNKK